MKRLLVRHLPELHGRWPSVLHGSNRTGFVAIDLDEETRVVPCQHSEPSEGGTSTPRISTYGKPNERQSQIMGMVCLCILLRWQINAHFFLVSRKWQVRVKVAEI